MTSGKKEFWSNQRTGALLIVNGGIRHHHADEGWASLLADAFDLYAGAIDLQNRPCGGSWALFTRSMSSAANKEG